jgi:membrane associated rhomboid family serine protease
MITFYLLLVQLTLYIITVAYSKHLTWILSPDIDILLYFGANARQRVRCLGHVHRLLSYVLLHGSFIHVILNFFSEFLFVLPMEHAWGHLKFLFIYIVTGVTGGLFSNMRRDVVSVGASCSIFGVQGVFLVIVAIYWSKIPDVAKPVLRLNIILVPVLFVAVSFLPAVDWLGHLGGFFGGLAIGSLVFGRLVEEKRKRRLFWIFGGVLLGLVVIIPLGVVFGTKTVC